jgi:hypothetical protein
MPICAFQTAKLEANLWPMKQERYEGRPLIRLLELYVLWAVGKLTPEQATKTEAMTPQLEAAYGVRGQWHEIVTRAIGFPPTMRSSLVSMWQENVAKFGPELDPQSFAEAVVDKHFAPLIKE